MNKAAAGGGNRHSNTRYVLILLAVAAMAAVTVSCPVPGVAVKTVAAPVFSPSPGVYGEDQYITISCPLAGAVVHYTTDGFTPTASSPQFSTSIPVQGDGTMLTLKAIALTEGQEPSSVATAVYTINTSYVSVPQFTPAGGIYSEDVDVTIT